MKVFFTFICYKGYKKGIQMLLAKMEKNYSDNKLYYNLQKYNLQN